MAKDIAVFLKHIIESAELIEEYLVEIDKELFKKSKQIQDSVIRRLEIIGEAVKNIPDDYKKSHTGIPWKQLAGLRDVLIHQYFGVDIELTWEIARYEIPKLKRILMDVLNNEGS